MERALAKNMKRILDSAKAVYAMKDYTSAAILYFKALFMAIDYVILQNEGRIPHDHGDRFRICEKKYPNLYRILDKLFPTYRTTYTTEISKETTDEVRKSVSALVQEYSIPLEGK
ncbi:MAG: hypothetical protein ABIA93_02735 [Candidatus Woesearchaeota archaeon]